MTITITILPFILLGVWLLMWAINEVFAVKAPVYRSIMIIVAFLAGLGLIFVR